MQFIHDINAILQLEQTHEPFFIFKHSTQCPISAQAHNAFEAFLEQTDAAYVAVQVIEDRSLSNQIEQKYGVQHQSPQAILLRGEEVLWHDSHRDLTTEEFLDVWNSHKQT